MNKIKAKYLFASAIICYIISFVLLYTMPDTDEGTFSMIIGLTGLILLVMAIIKLAKGKVPAGEKIICPHCKGQAREYRSMVIKIIYPLLFLTPKYICMDCKKLFNIPYETPIDLTNKMS